MIAVLCAGHLLSIAPFNDTILNESFHFLTARCCEIFALESCIPFTSSLTVSSPLLSRSKICSRFAWTSVLHISACSSGIFLRMCQAPWKYWSFEISQLRSRSQMQLSRQVTFSAARRGGSGCDIRTTYSKIKDTVRSTRLITIYAIIDTASETK